MKFARLASLVAILMLAGAVSAQEAATKAMRFTWKCPQKGDALGSHETGHIALDIDVSMDGQILDQSQQTQEIENKKRSEILAAEATKVTKVKVSYDQIVHDIEGQGSLAEDAAAILGKSFVVDFSGEAPSVSNEAGEAASEAQKKLVLERESQDGAYTGWGPDFRKILPDRPIAIGETFTVTGADAAGFLPGRDADFDPSESKLSVEMTLVDTKKMLGTECGVFDVAIVMSGVTSQDDAMTVELKPKGQFLLGTSNMWVYKMTMEGPIKVSGTVQDGAISVLGKGTAKFAGQALYGKN
ncbi:MAG: hypothetical protein KDB53_16485 [Planctomycetes bacterium]|nr:hypothetical protein [Planctomycetota bacterium]